MTYEESPLGIITDDVEDLIRLVREIDNYLYRRSEFGKKKNKPEIV